MKKILIVDDDRIGLNFLAKQIRAKMTDIETLTAENGKEAVDVLKKETVELVVTDLKMPEMDGFELMAYLGTAHPHVSIFVMTSHGAPKIKAKLEAIGPSRYFDKPVNLDVFIKSISSALDSGMEGQLKGISLMSFLQLVSMDRKTCTLTVSSRHRQGKMYFVKGEIFCAEMADLRNIDAVREIMGWEHVEIHIDNKSDKTVNEINQSILSILTNFMYVQDKVST